MIKDQDQVDAQEKFKLKAEQFLAKLKTGLVDEEGDHKEYDELLEDYIKQLNFSGYCSTTLNDLMIEIISYRTAHLTFWYA